VSTGRFRGQTADQRRSRRRRQLMDAAMDIIADRGVAGLKVRAVCVRAGLNDRYFYESFADCEALLLAAFDDQFAVAMMTLMAAAAAAPAQSGPTTRAAVEAAFRFVDQDPRRRRFLVEVQTTEALQTRRRDLVRALAQVIVDQARELLNDRHPDPNETLAALALVSGLMELTTLWLQDELDVTREQLVEFMIAMILTASDITTVVDRELTEHTTHQGPAIA
jgi:AcrR family transcriptional regulator